MKSSIALLFLVSLILPGQQHELNVVVSNIQTAEGEIFLQVLNEKGKTISTRSIPAREEKAIFDIEVSTGTYAVKVFHDLNSNGELDKNSAGSPNEPYGFSADVDRKFGQSSLEDQVFSIDRDTRISISLR